MTYLLVTCKALGQSPLQPDQYRSSIKSPVLLYSPDSIQTYNDSDYTQLNYNYYYKCTTTTIQLETALCYQYCFCNTELPIQTQQNTFVSFTLFNLALDERKTLTKVSTHNLSQPFPRMSACFGQVENRQETFMHEKGPLAYASPRGGNL